MKLSKVSSVLSAILLIGFVDGQAPYSNCFTSSFNGRVYCQSDAEAGVGHPEILDKVALMTYTCPSGDVVSGALGEFEVPGSEMDMMYYFAIPEIGLYVGGQQDPAATQPDEGWTWNSGADFVSEWAPLEPTNSGPLGEYCLSYKAVGFNDIGGFNEIGFVVQFDCSTAAPPTTGTLADTWTVAGGILTEDVGAVPGNNQVSFDHGVGEGPGPGAAIFDIFARVGGPDALVPESACYSFGDSSLVTSKGPVAAVGGTSAGLTTVSLDEYTGTSPLYQSAWTFSLDGSISDDTDMFQVAPDGQSATVHFCVRFGLFSSDFGELANFREVAVVATIDLAAGFEMTNMFAVQAAEATQSTASESFTVTAAPCDATATFSAGGTIPMCICPDSGVTSVASIQNLQFTDGSGTITQTSVLDGALTNSLAADGGCTDGCCQVDTLLRGVFYSGVGLADPSVTVTGDVLLTISGSPLRRLVRISGDNNGRDLQEEQTQQDVAFEATIKLEPSDEESSAVASTTLIGLALAALFALIM